MFNNGYPTNTFTRFDNSGARTDVSFSAPTNGLNVPFAFIMAERGRPGAMYFGGSKELTPLLGSATFDPNGPYFNASTQFIGMQMAGQGVEVMRLVDPEATVATLGIFVTLVSKDIVQYKKDSGGNRIVDGNGNPIPLLKADGVTVKTEPGVQVKWTRRVLDSAQESFETLKVQTSLIDGVESVTYPILAWEVDSQGEYGNRQGVSLYAPRTIDTSIEQEISSILYRFAPIALSAGVSTTASAMPDIYGALYNDVSFKSSAIYPQTNVNYAFSSVIGNKYVDSSVSQTQLPYNLKAYGDNVRKIGERILSVSPDLTFTDPYLVNLISCADFEGFNYDHVELHEASYSVVNSDVVNYGLGGSDGDTSWEKFEELVAGWLSGSNHGEFTHLQQHPITHFSDPGFSMAVKPLLYNMLSLRTGLKIDVSTQDRSRRPNTKAEDLAAGQLLMFRAQLHPDNVITGVGCSRVGIYAHAAELTTGSVQGGIIPFTLNRAIQRRDLDGGTYIRGTSGGLPNSEVTMFRKPNWVADDETSQKLAWASCINAVRHADRTTIHYPTYRTTYPNDTSLLSDDEISDRLIYMEKICRYFYAKYVGRRDQPLKNLFPLMERDINTACSEAFASDPVRVVAKVFQTAQDENLASVVSVNLNVTGNLPMRTMNFNVIVGRAPAEQ